MKKFQLKSTMLLGACHQVPYFVNKSHIISEGGLLLNLIFQKNHNNRHLADIISQKFLVK